MNAQTKISNDITYAVGKKRDEIDAIVRQYGPMVRRIAWHVHSRMSSAIEIADLIQVGLIALVDAVRTFEDRGLPIGPYLATRVRGSMIDELRREARISRAGLKDRKTLAKTRSEIESRLLRPATDQEMSEALNMTPVQFHAMVFNSINVEQTSLNDSYDDHNIHFSDTSDNAHVLMEQSELKKLMMTAISELPERESMVLSLYFVDELNLDEIGSVLNIGAARVCQIKKAALAKIREKIQTEE